MARVSRFWLLAMFTAVAVAVVIGGLTLPQAEAVAADPDSQVAPALVVTSKVLSMDQIPPG